MKTNLKLSMLLIVLIALPVLLGSGCSQGSLIVTTTVPGTQTTITVPVTGDTSTVGIELKDFKFMPDTVEVKAGNTVILNLVNGDSVDHTFTLEAFNRDVKLPAGTQASIQFFAGKAGTFEFHCSIHPSMRGQLIVTQ